jgi:hypothetical protein
MDCEQAEQRFQELQAQRASGELDKETFHVEVAKLLFQDEQGIFWMPDADTGTWYCSRGESWEPGDPHAEPVHSVDQDVGRGAERRRRGRLLALGVALLALLGLAGSVALWLAPSEVAWSPFQPVPVEEVRVEVSIASPADGSQIALGQVVAIESTIGAERNLQAVDRVVLQVDGQTVDVQTLDLQIQPAQTSFPLSLPWRPDAVGEYQVGVTVLSAEDKPLGTAAVILQVAEASEEALPEPDCTPDGAFVADVTIPPGTAFPPRARMDKVWQVRNSGSCAWGIGYELAQVAEEGLGAPGTVPVPPTGAGELADLTITLWAPTQAGTYANVWQLRSPDGEFFGPTLPLTFHVEALAQESLPPIAPADLLATSSEDGKAVRLTWLDQSGNEDAFRVYRTDVEANIGLAPANTEQFVDEEVACGNTYRYSVMAFNAAGTSGASTTAEVALPPCTPTDTPPALSLTVVPTQVQASETFTVAFEASDDSGLDIVVVWGEETSDLMLDSGRIFTCTQIVCTGTWPVAWMAEVSTTIRLVAVALDSSGQESEQARTTVTILAPE